MTSRRDFLKAAAIAPIAAPAVIAAVAAPRFASGGYVRGISGFVGEAVTGEALMTPNQVRALGGFRPLEIRAADLEFVTSREFQIDEICRAFEVERWQISAAPNRLKGAYIKPDGDAV